MSPESLKTVAEFAKLPDTEEKADIQRRYLADEMCAFDFYLLAAEYLSRVTK